MAKKKNKYEGSTRKKSALAGITMSLATKGKLKNTAIETVKELVVGVIGGGLAGAAIGRASLITGAVISGIGHYTDTRLASIFGFGMMASNGFQKSSDSVSGTDKQGFLEGIKERVLTYKDSLLTKFYADKIMKKKQQSSSGEGTSGIGSVQYFVYPGNKNKETDMSELERIEKAVADSAEQFRQQQGTEGINGTGESLDPGEKIY